MTMTINDLVKESHATARRKGWHEGLERMTDYNRVGTLLLPTTDHVLAWLALIHAELSEAVAVARETDDYTSITIREADGKPEGFATELADVVIYIGDVCGALGIDLAAALKLKMAHNETRPHRHGDKLA